MTKYLIKGERRQKYWGRRQKYPQSFRLCVMAAQVLDCTCELFYQVDQGWRSDKYHGDEHPKVLQMEHTDCIWSPLSHYDR